MRWFCLLLVAIFPLLSPPTEARKASGVDACFQSALVKKLPTERDRQRFLCLKRHGRRLTLPACLSVSRKFEYSIHSEEAKKNCLFESPSRINVANCLATAEAMAYGENRDEILITCLQELSPQLHRRDCLKLAQKLVFSPTRDRVTSYCKSEL